MKTRGSRGTRSTTYTKRLHRYPIAILSISNTTDWYRRSSTTVRCIALLEAQSGVIAVFRVDILFLSPKVSFLKSDYLVDQRLQRQMKLMRCSANVQQRLARLFASGEINESTFRKTISNNFELFLLQNKSK